MQKFQYVLNYASKTVLLQSDEVTESPFVPEQFAQITDGVINLKATEIVYASQPNFSKVNILWPDGTLSVAGPVRRPI